MLYNFYDRVILVKDNKINVDLIVPSIDEKYNIFIPVNKSIGEVILILSNMLNELTTYFTYNKTLCLLDVYENKIYSFDEDVKSAGIKNGAVLALI